MPRNGTAHRYTLTSSASSRSLSRPDLTAAQVAVLAYLALRATEGRGGATQAEIVEESGMAERTVGTAVRKLAELGIIGGPVRSTPLVTQPGEN